MQVKVARDLFAVLVVHVRRKDARRVSCLCERLRQLCPELTRQKAQSPARFVRQEEAPREPVPLLARKKLTEDFATFAKLNELVVKRRKSRANRLSQL